MLRGTELLVAVRSWISDRPTEWAALGAASEIEESPTDRDPRSIRWILESSEMMGQIIVWEDGQAELDLADVTTGAVRSEHRHIDSDENLESAMSDIRAWVRKS